MTDRRSSRRLPPLPALRAFEAAARHLSFKAAAEELAVTPTAVSHHVRQLEDALGLRLFVRRPRRVALTPEGRMLYPVLRDGFDAFAEAIARLRRQRLKPVVTLSATVAFTARWLVPRVAAFHAANPGLDLRLHASDDPVDLLAGTADAAVRYGRAVPAGLVGDLLFEDMFAPVCSPALGLNHPRELAEHTLIHFEWRRPHRDNPVWERWLAEAGLPGLVPRAELTLSDESQAVQALVAGQGVALAGLVLVADEIAAGRLVVPFGPRLRGYDYRLVYPADPPHPERIAALRSWIRQEAAGGLGLAGRT
ncbi:LysR family glycine cleavage system transcriptional activator [Chelatococcus caeni]|uniref:LysR family glycine cleavage system transcriptional activator n=1 Tax=Chelatococcus caeni TaxID=1348468 RepID=A0A840BQ93_9HYPH|nr:LysR substrate-binding domain-containing protein [Chelatococcus caeni]MBB4015495.1 LysR family glycine cleavage system transcriptional activator [Chelatococcus caeni]